MVKKASKPKYTEERPAGKPLKNELEEFFKPTKAVKQPKRKKSNG